MSAALLAAALLLQEPARPAGPAAEPDVEVIRLDIRDRQITEEDYRAARSLRLRAAEGPSLAVEVGAAVEAGRINVRLRNVHGLVRFRASLDDLRHRLRGLAFEPRASDTPRPDDRSTR